MLDELAWTALAWGAASKRPEATVGPAKARSSRSRASKEMVGMPVLVKVFAARAAARVAEGVDDENQPICGHTNSASTRFVAWLRDIAS